MKYKVYFRVKARFAAEVEAASVEEALATASESFDSADFGDAYEVEGTFHHAEDADENYIEVNG